MIKNQTSKYFKKCLGKLILGVMMVLIITVPAIAVESVDVGPFTIQFWQKADGDPDAAGSAVAPFRDFTAVEKEQIIRAFEYWAATIPATSATRKAVIRLVPSDTGAAYSSNVTNNIKNTTSESGTQRAQTYPFEILAENRNIAPSLFTVTTPGTAPQPSTQFSCHSMIVINVDSVYKDNRTPTQVIGNASNTSSRPIVQGMIHEIGHSLGLAGGVASGTEFPNMISVFASHLRDSHGVAASNGGNVQSGNTYTAGSGFDLTTLASGYYAYFRGTEVDKLLGLTGTPANTASVGLKILGREPATAPIDGNALTHSGIFQSVMSYGAFRSIPFFSEVELAALEDIGYEVNRADSFGKSYYVSGTTNTNTNGFGTKANPNTKLYGVGLHVFSNNNNIIQKGNIYANGDGGAGIRIDGSGNTITIDANVDVYANGLNGIGLLNSVGSNNIIIAKKGSNIQGTGTNGIGALFDTGSSDIESHGNVTLTSIDPRRASELAELKTLMSDAMVDRFDISGSISGTTAAISIADNAHVRQINFMSGANISGDIKTDYGNPTTLTFGKLANADGEATNNGDTNFKFNYEGNITSSMFNLETWGGETTLSSAATLNFYEGSVGEGTVASILNLPGTASFSWLDLGSTNNTSSVLDGKTTGNVSVSNGYLVTNNITVQNLALFKVVNLTNAAGATLQNNATLQISGKLDNKGTVNDNNTVTVTNDIENSNLIQNVTTLQTSANLDNTAAGKIISNTNIKVGGKLTNAGLIDTAQLVEVTGDIDNSKLIQNVTTLKTEANLNNIGVDAEIVNNTTINVGVDLTNSGTIDEYKTLTVGQDATNTGNINVKHDSTANIGRNVSNAGHIKANGQVTVGNQFNNNAGLVSGNGNITTTNGFINNGVISPGNSIGTLTIDGPFVNNADGRFDIELDPSHYPSQPFAGLHNDLVKINAGTATINGGNVWVASQSNDKTKTAAPARYVGNSHYTFLDTENAGNLSVNNALTVQDPADILLFDFVADHDTKSYWLDVQREYYYGQFGDTRNQVAVGNYIDQIGLDPNPLGDFFDVLVSLDRLNAGIAHRAGISRAAKFSLDQMSGSVYATIANAGIQNTTIVNNTLADVLRRNAFNSQADCNPCDEVDDNCNPCDPCDPCASCDQYESCDSCDPRKSSRWNTWGLGFGTGGRTQFDGNAYGYNQSFAGTIIGIDRLYKRNLRVGAFASYGEGRVSSGLLDRSKSNEFLAGLYFRKGMNVGYFMANAGLGNNRYDTQRTISFVNRKTKNEHDAIVGTVYLERGLEIKRHRGVLQPFVGLQYVGSQQDGFTERGAGSLNLTATSTDGHSLRSLLGSRFSTNAGKFNKGKLSYYGNAIWMHEFIRSYSNFSAEFSNPAFANFSSTGKFTVRGNDSKRDWAIIGAGVNYEKNRIRLFAGYDAYANGQQVLHTGNAGFVYGW